MADDLYHEKLEWFKENEQPEAVLFIGEDSALMKIVLAWTNTPVQPAKKLGPLCGESASEIWQWLWANTEYSRQDLIARCGAFEHGFEAKLAILIGNRLLYPDGTVNSFVQRYLREKVLKLFEKRGGKSKGSSR